MRSILLLEESVSRGRGRYYSVIITERSKSGELSIYVTVELMCVGVGVC
jgi:hypothetical protein